MNTLFVLLLSFVMCELYAWRKKDSWWEILYAWRERGINSVQAGDSLAMTALVFGLSTRQGMPCHVPKCPICMGADHQSNIRTINKLLVSWSLLINLVLHIHIYRYKIDIIRYKIRIYIYLYIDTGFIFKEIYKIKNKEVYLRKI